MNRLLLNIAALLSTLLGIFIIAVWIRSHYPTTRYEWTRRDLLAPRELRQREYQLHLAKNALFLQGSDWTITDRSQILGLARRPTGVWTFLREPIGGVVQFSPLPKSILGLGYQSTGGTGQTIPGFFFRLPYWMALLPCCLLPAIWFRNNLHSRTQRKWAATGCCPRCGYDLRASPARCPECGQANPTPNTSPNAA